MGLFSKKKSPELKVPTAEELYQQALGWAQGAMPYTTGARETAAKYLTTQPFERKIDYSQYQPTSFEQAMGTQNFENVWPDVQRQIRQALSLSGFAQSPILAQLEGRERGNIGVNIGQYLTELGQRRAEADEQARRYNVSSALGIDPMNMISPFVSTAQTQSMAQQIANLENYNRQAQGGWGAPIGSLLGGVGGFMLGGPAGGMLGASLGGQVGSMFGGSNPVDISTALKMMELMPGKTQTATPVMTGGSGGWYGNSGLDYGNRMSGYIPEMMSDLQFRAPTGFSGY